MLAQRGSGTTTNCCHRCDNVEINGLLFSSRHGMSGLQHNARNSAALNCLRMMQLASSAASVCSVYAVQKTYRASIFLRFLIGAVCAGAGKDRFGLPRLGALVQSPLGIYDSARQNGRHTFNFTIGN
ncbi:hypothetical protein EVAR_46386_1 [Eumeta japonica]|uniref:Uncharacterized protein n=1 Tax=Eumeta variegata TaxID=151549 RepID=A0A4C1WY67_EUMVA|nr:hypothetical protein EVAR_46386_1 [Eumeta japonica]